jgi:hypothetical protein
MRDGALSFAVRARLWDMKIAATFSSYTHFSCPFCLDKLDGHSLLEAASHLQDKHDLTCMHVGQQTDENPDGGLWQHTVAVFGSDNPPSPLTAGEVREASPQLAEMDALDK